MHLRKMRKFCINFLHYEQKNGSYILMSRFCAVQNLFFTAYDSSVSSGMNENNNQCRKIIIMSLLLFTDGVERAKRVIAQLVSCLSSKNIDYFVKHELYVGINESIFTKSRGWF